MSESTLLADPITQGLSTLGVGGITGLLAYLWVRKDKQYTDLTDKLSDAFEKNAEVNERLESTIRANTRATEKLESTITQQIFQILRDKNNV